MATLDLHDLATILLRERLLTEPSFKHCRLREINDRSKPRTSLPPHVRLPELDNLPQNTQVTAYFLADEADEDVRAPPVESSTFKLPDFTSSLPGPLTESQLQTAFWRIKNHDGGYVMAHAMQLILDNLPVDTKLRIRTSQGHSILTDPKAFSIVEEPIVPRLVTYICKVIKQPHLGPTKVQMDQFLTGANGPFPWCYLLFGGDDVARSDPESDGRVALDLVAPIIGMRGLGGEVFAMERMQDYQEKLLPQFTTERGRLIISERIIPGSSGRTVNDEDAVALSKRVLARLKRVDTFCAYCGKSKEDFPEGTSMAQCSACKKTRFCDRSCQTQGWKYHKKYCKIDASANSVESNNVSSG